jgi:hypothetical protein
MLSMCRRKGGSGISKRVAAWLAHHQIEPKNYADVLANFVVSAISIHPDSTDLDDVLSATIDHPDYRDELAEYVDPEEGGPLLFVIIDTLARCFSGDENQQEDMGQFVRRLDTLREQYAATVLVVHHSKKADSNERGSSAFRGACDTMMFVSKDGVDITLECTKQKDHDAFVERKYELAYLPEQDSCALTPWIAQEEKDRRNLQERLSQYRLSHPTSTVREIAEALGASRMTIHRMIQPNCTISRKKLVPSE